MGSSPTPDTTPTRDPALPTRDELAKLLHRAWWLHGWRPEPVEALDGYWERADAEHRERWAKEADAALALFSPALSAMRAERDALQLRLDQYLGWKPEDLADQISDAVKARMDLADMERAHTALLETARQCEEENARLRDDRDADRDAAVEAQGKLRVVERAAARRPTVGVTEAMRAVLNIRSKYGFPFCSHTKNEVTLHYETFDDARAASGAVQTARDEAKALSSATHALVEVGELKKLRSETGCPYCFAILDSWSREAVTKHAAVCEKHPSRAVEAERDAAIREREEAVEACATFCDEVGQNAAKASEKLKARLSGDLAAPSAGDVEACAKEIAKRACSVATMRREAGADALYWAEVAEILRRFWPHPSRTPVVTAEDVQAAYTAAVGFRCDDSFAARFAVRLAARLSPPAAAEKTEKA